MKRSWRTPAVVMICGGLIAWLSTGTRQSLALFLQPMSFDMNWGREVFSLAMGLQLLLWGVAQPIAGAISDKIGAAGVIIFGAALYIIGLVLMSGAGSPLLLYLSLGLFIGIGLSAAGFAVVFAAVARAVPPRRRSAALGITGAVGSVGQFAMIPVAQGVIGFSGWTTSLLVLAACMSLVIPLSIAMKGRPEPGGPREVEQSLLQALRQARSHPGFVYLTTAFFVCGFQTLFIGSHLPAFVTDSGLPPEVSALSLALIGAVNVVGSLMFGWLGGRYSKRGLLAFQYLLRSVAIVFYVLLPITTVSTCIFAGVIGLTWLGTVPLVSGLVAQMFGIRHIGMLFGITFFSHQLGAFFGTWIGGLLFDAYGNYDIIWWTSAWLGVTAALMHWPIEERDDAAAELAGARAVPGI